MPLDAWQIWTALALVLVIGEVLSTQFVLIGFAVGALVAALAARFGLPLPAQGLLFGLSSIVALAVARPLLRPLLAPRVATNVDALAGKTGLVIEAIAPPEQRGQVRVEGEDWWALTEDGQPLAVGARVRVARVDGARLIVRAE